MTAETYQGLPPPSDPARWHFASRFKRSLRSRCGGEPNEHERFIINEMAETAWQKEVALRWAAQAEAAGDAKRALEERKLFDRHRQALILLDRALDAATRHRPAEERSRPGPSFEEQLAAIAQRRAAE